MSRALPALLALVLLGAGATRLGAQAVPPAAQTPAEHAVAQGVQSVRDLEYDSAAAQLRRGLAHPSAARLADADRVKALAYLGATEVFRSRPDSAAAAFRRLLVLDPRYRPDQLVFPPEVTTAFDQARLTTRVILVAVPLRTDLAAPGDRLAVHLVASAPHGVVALVAREGGGIVRQLFAGPVADSVDVPWDGRDSAGTAVPSGRYVLRVTSRDADGQIVRTVAVPLEVRSGTADTLPLPPPPADSLFLPETAPAGTRNSHSLLRGALVAVAVVALPSIVGGGSDPAPARFLVAGLAGAAGVAGFAAQGRPMPIPANIAANQAVRLGWQHRVDQARTGNANRRRSVPLSITSGTPSAVGGQ